MNNKYLDFFIDNNNFAYNTDVTKETSKSIYSEGMYGDEYRLEKTTKKVYRNKEFIGIAERYNIY